MGGKKWIFVFLLSIVLHATAQQIHSQFYSQLSLPSSPSVNTLVQAEDYSIWMGGNNYGDGTAFLVRTNVKGNVKWYAKIGGSTDQDEIASLCPTLDGGCIFTMDRIYYSGKTGYGKIDSSGNVVWFNYCKDSNNVYVGIMRSLRFGSNYILAQSNATNFGTSGSITLLKIDQDGNLLDSATFHCAGNRIDKVFTDSHHNILICGDDLTHGGLFIAKTDSDFQSPTFHYFKNVVDQLHDATMNAADEIVFSGNHNEDYIGSVWNGALMKINTTTNQVVWAEHFISSDWIVCEFFGIEPSPDNASYFVIFEPEYFHGIETFPSIGILHVNEDGSADSIYYRSDSTNFFEMLERGKDQSYLEGATLVNGNQGTIWKSDQLITGNTIVGTPPFCFSGYQYYHYPFTNLTAYTGSISCTSAASLIYHPGTVSVNLSTTFADVDCSFYWEDYSGIPPGEDKSDEAVNLFPNPCLQSFNVESEIGISEVILFDVTGRMVMTRKLNDKTFTVDVSQLIAGVYFVTLKSGGREFNKKIIRQ